MRDDTSQDVSTMGNGHRPGTPENPLHTIMTVPNLITLCRLILTFCFLFMYPDTQYRTISVVIFIIAATTDWLDGQVARRFHQVSVFGKRFDPVMDRVLIFSGVIALVITNQIPLWIVCFLIVRDVYLLVGGTILKVLTGTIIDVVYVGKAATFVLMTGFAFVLLDIFRVPGLGLIESTALPGWGTTPESLGMWAVYVAVLLSFTAACVYTARGIRALRNARSRRQP